MITHNVAISDPRFEVENLRYLTVKSSFLKGRGDITVFIPPGHTESTDLPIVILLHGVNASHWAWTRQMNVHQVALEMIESKELIPMVLVMPSDGLLGGGSGYIQHHEVDYGRWISEDVIDAVRSTIPQLSGRSKLFISGLSMGGYGALRIGCKSGNQFSAVSGHSSVLDLEDLRFFIDDCPYPVSKDQRKQVSIIKTILDNKENLPPIRFDCGTEDDLIESNRKLHGQLDSTGIEHIYEEYPGGHTGDYWATHIRKSLLFFNQHLDA